MSTLGDDLRHIRKAASDACGFVEEMSKDDFLEDQRTDASTRENGDPTGGTHD